MKKSLLFSFLIVLCFGSLVIVWSYFDMQPISGCAFCEEEVLDAQEFDREHDVIALLTYKPITKGHVLIIPERHVEHFEDLSQREFSAMSTMIKRVDKTVKQRYGNSSYLLLIKSGVEAGQTVPHTHIHYLPRYASESHLAFALRVWFTQFLKPVSSIELAKELAFLRSAVQSNRSKSSASNPANSHE